MWCLMRSCFPILAAMKLRQRWGTHCLAGQGIIWSGDHPGNPVGLGEGDEADDGGEQQAVPEGRTEDFAFLADEADGGDTDGDVLRRNHLASDGSARIGGGEQDGAQVKLMSSSDLEITEEQVAGGVGAREEAGDPA